MRFTTYAHLMMPDNADDIDTFTQLDPNWQMIDVHQHRGLNYGGAGTYDFPKIVLDGSGTPGVAGANQGVTGVLPIANGGTGQSTGNWTNVALTDPIVRDHLYFGAKPSGVADASIYRGAANQINTDGLFVVGTAVYALGGLSVFIQPSTAAQALQLRPVDDLNLYAPIFAVTNTAVSYSRFSISKDGTLQWGSGTANADTKLYRGGIAYLVTDSTLAFLQPSVTSTLQMLVTGDSAYRFYMTTNGSMNWGSGTAGTDTNLYRGAASTLTTDGYFQVGQSLQLTSTGAARVSSTAAPLRLNTGTGDLIFERGGGQVGSFRASDNFFTVSFGIVSAGNIVAAGTLDVTGDAYLRAVVRITTAVGKIVPGPTSLSYRNSADTADNLLITDAGNVTVRANIVTPSIQINGSIFQNNVPNAQMIGGTVDWAVRNNANNANNLQVTDAGNVTIRNSLTVSSGGLVVTGNFTLAGAIVFAASAAVITGGTVSFSLRNNTGTVDNVLVTDAGNVTIRGNVGIGVTTSVWHSARNVLQAGQSASFSGNVGGLGLNIFDNTYLNASGQYVALATGPATQIVSNGSGGILFSTAPSVSAGVVQTFTTGMAINSSGLTVTGTNSNVFQTVGNATNNPPAGQYHFLFKGYVAGAGSGELLRLQNTNGYQNGPLLAGYYSGSPDVRTSYTTDGGNGAFGTYSYFDYLNQPSGHYNDYERVHAGLQLTYAGTVAADNGASIHFDSVQNYAGYNRLTIGAIKIANANPAAQNPLGRYSLYLVNSSTNTIQRTVWIDQTGVMPGTDNVLPLGSSSLRYTAVWAVTGTIQTSSVEVKEVLNEISPVVALQAVLQTPIYNFYYKDARGVVDTSVKRTGYLAEEAHPHLLVGEGLVSAQDTACIVMAALQQSYREFDVFKITADNRLLQLEQAVNTLEERFGLHENYCRDT